MEEHGFSITIQVPNSDSGLFRFMHDCGGPEVLTFLSFNTSRSTFFHQFKFLTIRLINETISDSFWALSYLKI